MVVRERPLHVHVPLLGVGGHVGRIIANGAGKLGRDRVEIREHVHAVDERRAGRRQVVPSRKRRNEARELQLVEIEVVVVDAEPGAKDGLVVQGVDDADARSEVVQVLLDDALRIEVVLVMTSGCSAGGRFAGTLWNAILPVAASNEASMSFTPATARDTPSADPSAR